MAFTQRNTSAGKKSGPGDGTKGTSSNPKMLKEVTVTRKTTPSSKLYLVKDTPTGGSREVNASGYSSHKGLKTTLDRDASGNPVIKGSGGALYKEKYTPLKKAPKKV